MREKITSEQILDLIDIKVIIKYVTDASNIDQVLDNIHDDVLTIYVRNNSDSSDILSKLDDDDILTYIGDNCDITSLRDKLSLVDNIEDSDIYNIYKEDVVDKINELSEKHGFLYILNKLTV